MQLEFTFRDEVSLRSELESRSGLRIYLTVTDNTRSMLSVKKEPTGRGVNVRLHHMFLSADPEVISALASWLKSSRSGNPSELVNEFIRSNAHQIRLQPEREIEPPIRGNVFDLAAIFRKLNLEQFQSVVKARIQWGRMPPSRRRRSIRFGSYTPCDNMIRIHPLLDQPFVPMYFMRYIMFHEMLHAFLGIEESPSGRRRYHTPVFLRRERAFPDYERAQAWQNDRTNLNRLLGRKP